MTENFQLSTITYTVRYRAICLDGDDTYKGPWRDDLLSAQKDALKHMKKEGNEDHVVDIIVESTNRMRFAPME